MKYGMRTAVSEDLIYVSVKVVASTDKMNKIRLWLGMSSHDVNPIQNSVSV